MSTGLIAGGSLAGIIIALLVVFEEFGKKIDFSIHETPGGEARYLVPAIAAFGVMAAALFAVALFGKRPVVDEPSNHGKVVYDDIGLQEGPWAQYRCISRNLLARCELLSPSPLHKGGKRAGCATARSATTKTCTSGLLQIRRYWPKPAALPWSLAVKGCSRVIGVLLVLSALAIVIDPGRAPAVLLFAIASAVVPWRAAWRGARRDGPAARIDLGSRSPSAWRSSHNSLPLAEPLSSGRPMAGRLTYLFVLAILAALVTVLNARTPGERVWAGLMFLLVVVFMIPWLEEAGRMRRPQGVVLVHLDSPWTLFYGLLVLVGVTNYLPTRFGLAAACLGVGFVLEYLGLTRSDWPLERRAVVWEWVAWTFTLAVWVARWQASRAPKAPGFNAIWFWFRDHWGVVWALATRSGLIARPSSRDGRSG